MNNEVMMSEQLEVSPEDVLIEVLKSQKSMKADIHYLKEEAPINPSSCLLMEQYRKKRVIECLGGKDSNAYRDKAFAQSVFRQAAKDFKDHFRVARYDMVKKRDEQAAFEYWSQWEPATNTKMAIAQRNSQMAVV